MDDPRSESSQNLEQWIQGCTALLAPSADWEPDLNVARARFAARRRRRLRLRRYSLIAAMAAVVACVVLYGILPPRKVFAQRINSTGSYFVFRLYRVEQLWRWITLVRPGPVLLPSLQEHLGLLHAQALTESGAAQAVSDVAEATRRAGFVPFLPHSEVLSKSPQLSVFGPMSYRTVVRTADLEQALRERGVPDQDVPKSWDGTQITLQMGARVAAEWTDVPAGSSGESEWLELTLVQVPPLVVATPTGFDLAAFTAANLRAAGMRNRQAALKLAQLNTTAPALLLGNLPAPRHAGVRAVDLLAGPATLIEEFAMPRPGARSGWFEPSGPEVERVTLLWSRPDRVYMLSGTMRVPCDMFGLDMAGALTDLMDLAISIE